MTNNDALRAFHTLRESSYRTTMKGQQSVCPDCWFKRGEGHAKTCLWEALEAALAAEKPKQQQAEAADLAAFPVSETEAEEPFVDCECGHWEQSHAVNGSRICAFVTCKCEHFQPATDTANEEK